MAKFCPKCCDEFKDNVDICPVDKVKLKEKPCKDEEVIFVDIYAAKDEIEAERITAFLKKDGVVARELSEGISQLPVSSDIRYVLAVAKSDALKARRIIENARNDGVISDDGNFL